MKGLARYADRLPQPLSFEDENPKSRTAGYLGHSPIWLYFIQNNLNQFILQTNNPESEYILRSGEWLLFIDLSDKFVCVAIMLTGR